MNSRDALRHRLSPTHDGSARGLRSFDHRRAELCSDRWAASGRGYHVPGIGNFRSSLPLCRRNDRGQIPTGREPTALAEAPPHITLPSAVTTSPPPTSSSRASPVGCRHCGRSPPRGRLKTAVEAERQRRCKPVGRCIRPCALTSILFQIRRPIQCCDRGPSLGKQPRRLADSVEPSRSRFAA